MRAKSYKDNLCLIDLIELVDINDNILDFTDLVFLFNLFVLLFGFLFVLDNQLILDILKNLDK